MGYFLDLLQETQRLRAEKKMQDDVAEIQRRARQAGRDIADGCIAFANALRNNLVLNKEVEFITVPRGWCKKEFERSKKMNKPKFKVGDKVKILDGSKIKDYTNGWVDYMSKYVGEEDTIIESESFGGDRYGCHLKNRGCVWDERGLELVKEKKEKKPSKNTAIVIYRKGDDTIALDKDTGKTAKATCSKDDEYDFYTGAKLALGRLTEPTRKFKVGDKVIGNKKANGVYAITKEGWKGVVKEIHTYPYIVVEKNGFSPEVDENCFDLDLDTEAEAEEPIKVGDKVKVVDTGEVFTTDYTWVSVHVHDDTHKIRYAFNDGMGFDCGVYELAEIYTVMYIAEGKAYITVRPDDSYYPCYLVGLDGLEKV